MIENTPIFNVTKETFDLLLDNELKSLFNKINTEYLYWDKVKYLAPKGVRPEDLWAAVKIIRNSNMKRVQQLVVGNGGTGFCFIKNRNRK